VVVLASPFAVLRASVYGGSADLHAIIEMAGALLGPILLSAQVVSRRLGRSTHPKRETVRSSLFVLAAATRWSGG